MGNDQGRRHSRKKRRTKVKTISNNQPLTIEMRFVDTDDDYVWENHVIGRLPFKEPDEVEIVFTTTNLGRRIESMENFTF